MKFNEDFQWRNKNLWIVLFAFFFLRIFLAANFIMANDEVYYWDWSRNLQLSYIDAPPFVAWVSYIGQLIFKHELGARFLIPFLHIFSVIFLIKSTLILAKEKNKPVKNRTILTLLILTELCPVFHLEGFLLLPDAPLLFGISGALYFILKSFSQLNFQNKLSIGNAICFGFFLGVGALSKYHTLPIAIGFFVAALLIRRQKTWTSDFLFWFFSILTAVLVSSPVFIWNYQNHFASFIFQTQHGFSEMSLDLKAFSRYLFGTIMYLFPWIFIPMMWFAFKNTTLLRFLFSKKQELIPSQLILFCLMPFFFLFFIILFSALGKQALPHWAMPGFFLLIPAFVLQWDPLENLNKKISVFFLSFSLFISVFIPLAVSFPSCQQWLMDRFVSITGNADPLAGAMLWKDLELKLKEQKNLQIPDETYAHQLSPDYCKTHPLSLGSFRWFWTAQMAFYFQKQPRVFNFDFSSSSFYTWRDPLEKLAGCRFLLIGSPDHFNEENLKKIMSIEKKEILTVSPFDQTKILYLEGVIKDKETLFKTSQNLKNNIHY